MATEIERKYLVRGDTWRTSEGVHYLQGYLADQDGMTVRVRMAGPKGKLTIKGPSQGATRAEFEYSIPPEDARAMLETLCTGPLIDKQRYTVMVGDHEWVIDEFTGDNAGLIIAEIELTSEDEAFEMPEWAGVEVTAHGRFFNSQLVKHPFNTWTPAEQAGE
ncbi:MAG: CYTH domain-containing protein [Bradymonadia bacterium]